MYAAICEVQERLTDLEGCGVPELHPNFCRGAFRYKQSHTTFVENEQRIIDLVRALNLSNRILEGCWKHERSLLEAILDIRAPKRARRSALVCLLSPSDGTAGKQSSTVMVTGANSKLVGSVTSPAGSEAITGSDASPKRSELGALVHIAAPDVLILGENLEDVNDLIYSAKNE